MVSRARWSGSSAVLILETAGRRFRPIRLKFHFTGRVAAPAAPRSRRPPVGRWGGGASGREQGPPPSGLTTYTTRKALGLYRRLAAASTMQEERRDGMSDERPHGGPATGLVLDSPRCWRPGRPHQRTGLRGVHRAGAGPAASTAVPLGPCRQPARGPLHDGDGPDPAGRPGRPGRGGRRRRRQPPPRKGSGSSATSSDDGWTAPSPTCRTRSTVPFRSPQTRSVSVAFSRSSATFRRRYGDATNSTPERCGTPTR